MSKQSDQTTSFVLRFTQHIFEDNQGESNVQWRGKITHVQGDDQKNFAEMEEAISFMQKKLSEMTLSSIDEKSESEKEGILTKSFDIWKRMAKSYPKMVMEVIKDPKGQVVQLQEQLTHVSEEIGDKIEIDSWRAASRNDVKEMKQMMESMSKQIKKLSDKVDKVTKKKSK